MVTTITGNEVETEDTDTGTLSGGLTNGQIARALLGNGLALNSAGQIVVKNSEQVGGQTVRELLGAYSFSGEALVGNGDGLVLTARTDASGDRTGIAINPSADYPNGTELAGDVMITGTLRQQDQLKYESPLIMDAVNSRPKKVTMVQVRSENNTPLFTVENGKASRTTLYNGTLAIGSDRRVGSDQNSIGKVVQFGDTDVEIRGDVNGGLVAQDKNGNLKTII